MPLIVGTAGHIDHGKTSLVRALTGQDTDRLKEERERGISIDLGFAWLDGPDGQRAGIVDVPGHERFVRNMLAGAHGMDLVLFTVAADDGIMPQTEEHLDILHVLGVQRGIFCDHEDRPRRRRAGRDGARGDRDPRPRHEPRRRRSCPCRRSTAGARRAAGRDRRPAGRASATGRDKDTSGCPSTARSSCGRGGRRHRHRGGRGSPTGRGCGSCRAGRRPAGAGSRCTARPRRAPAGASASR